MKSFAYLIWNQIIHDVCQFLKTSDFLYLPLALVQLQIACEILALSENSGSPFSCSMNPYPFASLNHFTVPLNYFEFGKVYLPAVRNLFFLPLVSLILVQLQSRIWCECFGPQFSCSKTPYPFTTLNHFIGLVTFSNLGGVPTAIVLCWLCWCKGANPFTAKYVECNA